MAIGKKYPINTTGDSNIAYNCSCLVNDSVALQYPEIANTTTVNQTLCLVSQFQSTLLEYNYFNMKRFIRNYIVHENIM